MVGVIAKKLNMTQVPMPNGLIQPVTLVQVVPNVITQIKLPDKDGYAALQVGTLGKKKVNKPLAGHLKQVGVKATLLREVRIEKDRAADYKVGDSLGIDLFAVGDLLKVRGISKGKGFAGTIKRHGFHRGPSSHGHDHHRAPGSIGAMGVPRVIKGKKMAGRMGGAQITLKKVKVVAVDTKSGVMAVSGSLPGHWHSFLLIEKLASPEKKDSKQKK